MSKAKGGVALVGTHSQHKGHAGSEAANNQFNAKPSVHPISNNAGSYPSAVGANKSRRYFVKHK